MVELKVNLVEAGEIDIKFILDGVMEKIHNEVTLDKKEPDELEPYFKVFDEWKKIFKRRNPFIKELSKERRRVLYQEYYSNFYYEVVLVEFDAWKKEKIIA